MTDPGETLAESDPGDVLDLAVESGDDEWTVTAEVVDNSSRRAEQGSSENGRINLSLEVSEDEMDRLDLRNEVLGLYFRETAPGEFDTAPLEQWTPYRGKDGEVVADWTGLGTVTAAEPAED